MVLGIHDTHRHFRMDVHAGVIELAVVHDARIGEQGVELGDPGLQMPLGILGSVVFRILGQITLIPGLGDLLRGLAEIALGDYESDLTFPDPPADVITAEPAGLAIDFELRSAAGGLDLHTTVHRDAPLPLRVEAVRFTPR